MAMKGGAAVRAGLASPSGWLLLAVNAAILLGAVLFGWSVFEIIFLFWAENVVIGIINVLRMLTASPDPAAPGQRGPGKKDTGWGVKLFLIPFFMVHYGGFCYGHGIFLFALFNEGGEFGDNLWAAAQTVIAGGLALSLGLLAASHLFSFLTNYLGKGEFRRTTPTELMARPYGRIMALHVTILVGGFLAMALGDPTWMLVVLVVLKAVVDLALHGREREKFAAQEGAVQGLQSGH